MGAVRAPSNDSDAHGARGRADSVISKWAGHDDSAFTGKTYVHAGLGTCNEAGLALARIPVW
jgi:hypothetical protein